MAGIETASAITGIVSFGLQVTKGLVDYYNAWKDQDAEVAEICASLGNLYNILQVLEGTIQRLPPGDLRLTNSMSGSLDNVKNAMNNLQTKLDKIRGKGTPVTGKLSLKSRRIRKAFYPFEQKTLLKVQQYVTDARSNLDFALQVLQVDTISDIRPDIKSLVRWEEDKETKKIIQWLSPVNFWLKQQDVQRQRNAGTGQWLLDHPKFLDCVIGNIDTLWCVGSPGVGKTVLASTIIHFLEDDLAGPKIGLAFIFCNHKDNLSQRLEYFLAAIARQLVEGTQTLPQELRKLHQKHDGKETSPTLQELETLLPSILREYSEVYMVVDALDECIDENERMIWSNLVTSLKMLLPTLRLICTSRDLEDSRGIFKNSARLDISASDEDIDTFIRAQLGPGELLFEIIEDYPDIEDMIVQDIVSKSEGIFLAAQLYIEYLAESMSIGALNLALKALPATLDENYGEAMKRIKRQRGNTKALALKVLSWVTYAVRPLHPEELQHALGIDHWELDNPSFHLTDFLTPRGAIINACAGLVRIEEQSNTVGLVHKTAHEYFKRTGGENLPDANKHIALSCIKYLSLDTFGEGECTSREALKARCEEKALFCYAAENLSSHWPAVEAQNEELKERTMKLFLDRKKMSSAGQVTIWNGLSHFQVTNFGGLHYASYCGMKDLVEALLETKEYHVEILDGFGYISPIWAARRGHEEVMKLFLESAGNAGKSSCWAATLRHAVLTEQENIVKMLVHTSRIDVDHVEEDGDTLLSLSIAQGNESIFKMMLAVSKADLNKDAGRNHYGMLHLAIERDYVESIESIGSISIILIESGRTDLELRDKYGRSPLCKATEFGCIPIVKNLLETGRVNVNARDYEGFTPLHHATVKRRPGIMKLLLDVDELDPNATTPGGLTPLHVAAFISNEAAVRLLLECGKVDVNLIDKAGRTPLLYAASAGRESIVRLLLQNGNVDINKTDKNNISPLAHAVQAGRQRIVEILLDTGKIDLKANIAIFKRIGLNDGVEVLRCFCKVYSRAKKLRS